jgi:hypothetical protein
MVHSANHFSASALFLQEKNDCPVSTALWFCESANGRRCGAQIGYDPGAMLIVSANCCKQREILSTAAGLCRFTLGDAAVAWHIAATRYREFRYRQPFLGVSSLNLAAASAAAFFLCEANRAFCG